MSKTLTKQEQLECMIEKYLSDPEMKAKIAEAIMKPLKPFIPLGQNKILISENELKALKIAETFRQSFPIIVECIKEDLRRNSPMISRILTGDMEQIIREYSCGKRMLP